MPTQTMFAVLNAEDESIISQPGVTGWSSMTTTEKLNHYGSSCLTIKIDTL